MTASEQIKCNIESGEDLLVDAQKYLLLSKYTPKWSSNYRHFYLAMYVHRILINSISLSAVTEE